MAVVKVTSGANAGKYAATNKDGVKQYFSSQSAGVAYAKTGGSSSSSSSSGSSSSGSSSGSSSTSTKSVAQQVADIAAQAQAIQDSFNEVKGTMTQSEIDKASAGITAATEGVKSIVDSGGVAKATGGSTNIINQGYAAALAGNPISLPTSTAPKSPAQITKLDTVVAPKVDPTVVSPSAGVALNDGSKAANDLNMQLFEKTQELIRKTNEENKSFWDKTMGTMKNPEDVYNQAWEDTGMSAKEYFATQESGIKQIESLNNEYATVKGAMEQQIAQTGDKMASMNFINNQTAQIRRNAEPQLNTLSAQISSKAATLQALQGNFAEARSLVNDAVNAATAGNKFKADMYSAFYEQNVDNFNRVEKNYSEAFQNAMNIALDDYKMQREEKMQIGELMLKYPSAGIDMNGTLDEAFQRAGVSSGGSGSGFTSTEIKRAMQVLNGQSAMSDFTTAEQAKIRDTIWSLDANMAGYQGKYPMSYAPGALENEFDALRMSVAGPGAGRIESSFNLDALNFDNL